MAASLFCMESASADDTPEVLLWVLGGPSVLLFSLWAMKHMPLSGI